MIQRKINIVNCCTGGGVGVQNFGLGREKMAKYKFFQKFFTDF